MASASGFKVLPVRVVGVYPYLLFAKLVSTIVASAHIERRGEGVDDECHCGG